MGQTTQFKLIHCAIRKVVMDDFQALEQQFLSASDKNKLQLIGQLSASESGSQVLRTYWDSSRAAATPDPLSGSIYQALYHSNNLNNQAFLQERGLGNGIIELRSENQIDYQPLQQLLIEQDFQAADSLTRQKLWELAGEAALKRKWLYFTEVKNMANSDLHTIDQLWWVYSQGQFGFSVQRQIWLAVGQDFSKLWTKIGWKSDSGWTKYPNEFTWDLSAPKGHLPLSNQLRGVRVIASIFEHPVWHKMPA
jgi:hypothetical protein